MAYRYTIRPACIKCGVASPQKPTEPVCSWCRDYETRVANRERLLNRVKEAIVAQKQWSEERMLRKEISRQEAEAKRIKLNRSLDEVMESIKVHKQRSKEIWQARDKKRKELAARQIAILTE